MMPMLENDLRYVYNVILILTKCWIINQNCNPFFDNVRYNYDKFYHLSFEDTVNEYTVKHLPYCRWVWQHATNLLTTSIDYNVALFYFLYIATDEDDNIGVLPRTNGDLLLKVLYGPDSICTLLKQSIHDYNNNRGNEDLLLVAALYGEYNNGPNYFEDLKKIHYESNLKLIPSDAKLIIKGLITADTIQEDQ